MLIIVDKKIPEEAKNRLTFLAQEMQGFLVEFETTGLVYPEISGHPDIFFCQTPQTLVISPNLPDRYVTLLDENKIPYNKGNHAAGRTDSGKASKERMATLKQQKKVENEGMVRYNAAIDDHVLVHRLEFTDPVILENCHYLKKITVKQGYTRCNLLLLKDNHYITSDQGIHKTLFGSGMKGLFVSPVPIILPGFQNGFIGGSMGISGNSVFINGTLRHLSEGDEIAEFLNELGYSIIELYDGPLFDGGGILFV
jgi:hypothetical protein